MLADIVRPRRSLSYFFSIQKFKASFKRVFVGDLPTI